MWMLKCSSVFLPVIMHFIMLCASLACSDTAASRGQTRFDKFMKTQFAKSCLTVQESRLY